MSQMDAFLLKPEEAAKVLGLGRSKLYELIQTGQIPSLRVGRARRIPVEALRRWVDKQLEAAEGSR